MLSFGATIFHFHEEEKQVFLLDVTQFAHKNGSEENYASHSAFTLSWMNVCVLCYC